jgi:3-oxoacyl-[acyl-carrier protein] reductase
MAQANISVFPKNADCAEPTHVATKFADFDKIQAGDEVQVSKIISAADVQEFADVSGDLNPLHMDEGFAARTRFQRRVVHGMLLANYVSALIGMRCPGPGALWSQQNFRWPAPVFIGDRIDLTLKVKHKSIGARTLTIEVKAVNQERKIVMTGEGTVTALEELQRTNEAPAIEQVALVNGASQGIGAAIASSLAQTGIRVALCYQDRAEAAEELCSEINANSGRAIAVQADLADHVAIVAAVEKISGEFNQPVTILINNVESFSEPRPFMQTTWEEAQAAIDAHVRSAFLCCQAVVPGMVERKSGRIVNIGSSFARSTPPVNWTNFLVAKSALQALTRSLATELGPYGIRVNMVSPGLVETEAIAGLSERLRKVQAMQTPLRRLASPAEIASVVTALCTSAGDFVTGAEIPVCGGLQM